MPQETQSGDALKRAVANARLRDVDIAPEVHATYSYRAAVPRNVWLELFQNARHEISVLVYSGLFIAEDVELVRLMARKAADGVTVRLLLGDPDSKHVAERGDEEGIDGAMAAKIRNALVLYRALADLDGVQIRLHRTVLYNSLYRADDDLLVNQHVYGIAAAYAPVLHRGGAAKARSSRPTWPASTASGTSRSRSAFPLSGPVRVALPRCRRSFRQPWSACR